MTAEPPSVSRDSLSPGRALLLGGLTVGTVDILDAFVFSLFRGSSPVRVLQAIASGALGRASFQGGAKTAALGLAIHFFIAFSVVAVYLGLSRAIPALRRWPYVFGPIYGLGVFFFMNLAVMPLAGLRVPPYPPRIVNGVLIHLLGVGLPAALFARAARAPGERGSVVSAGAKGEDMDSSERAATAAADPHDHPDIIAFPPLIALSVAALSGLVQWLVPLRWPFAGLSRWWALLPFLLAMSVVSAARHTMTAAGTNVRPDQPSTAIVGGGPYRFTRNPMYLSLLLIQLALGIATRWTWALGMIALLFALLHFGVVLREERYLEGKFGDVYRGYRSRVRRWL